MCEWKPIEEAPKDGTVVLLADDEGYVFHGAWEGWETSRWVIITDCTSLGAPCAPLWFFAYPDPPIKEKK